MSLDRQRQGTESSTVELLTKPVQSHQGADQGGRTLIDTQAQH